MKNEEEKTKWFLVFMFDHLQLIIDNVHTQWKLRSYATSGISKSRGQKLMPSSRPTSIEKYICSSRYHFTRVYAHRNVIVIEAVPHVRQAITDPVPGIGSVMTEAHAAVVVTDYGVM
jgi:hypothetical protein